MSAANGLIIQTDINTDQLVVKLFQSGVVSHQQWKTKRGLIDLIEDKKGMKTG